MRNLLQAKKRLRRNFLGRFAKRSTARYIRRMDEKPQARERTRTKAGTFEPFVPTETQRAQVLTLIGWGATIEQVAQKLVLSPTTVDKYFRNEIEQGWDLANLQLYSALWRAAMPGKDAKGNVKIGNIAALIFLAKNRLGMSDTGPRAPGGETPPPPAREELCIEVQYRVVNDPRALPMPSPERLAPPKKA